MISVCKHFCTCIVFRIPVIQMILSPSVLFLSSSNPQGSSNTTLLQHRYNMSPTRPGIAAESAWLQLQYDGTVPVKREVFLDSDCSYILLPLFSWETLTFITPSLFLTGSVSLHLLPLLCVFYLICKVIFIPVWLSAVLQHYQLTLCVCVCGGTDKCSTKISSMTCCWESRAWKFRLSISDSSFALMQTHTHTHTLSAWGRLIPQQSQDRHKMQQLSQDSIPDKPNCQSFDGMTTFLHLDLRGHIGETV